MEKAYDALINSKRVELNEEEASKAAEFHKRRCAFAWVNGKLVFNEDEGDSRDHEHWLKQDFGVTDTEFEKLVRGYMVEGYIQLFTGSNFKPVDTNEIPVMDFNNLVKKHGEIYHSTCVEVRNGVKVGVVGEVWPPLTILGNFNT